MTSNKCKIKQNMQWGIQSSKYTLSSNKGLWGAQDQDKICKYMSGNRKLEIFLFISDTYFYTKEVKTAFLGFMSLDGRGPASH